ncbi:MAG: hypothetical protein SF187_06600 [Deltaproteobacteria bacterium]|nr:hypothetical protein [Deltaproteobacteria bacterium]
MLRTIAFIAVGAHFAASSPQAFAYSVRNHSELFRSAASFFNECVQRHPQVIPPYLRPLERQEQILFQCSNIQDQKSIDRLKMWHFYSPKRIPKASVMRLGALAVDTRLDTFFAMAERAFEESNDPGLAYALVGAAIHYLQDVTVPSHVIPIFHPGIFDWHDEFDEYPVQSELVKADATTCAQWLSDQRSLGTILQDTAQDTLDSLHGPTNAFQGRLLSWEMFWKPGVDVDGFGKYGCFGDNFGSADLSCAGKAFRMSSHLYAAFARARHRMAVRSTVAAMAAVQRKTSTSTCACVSSKCPFPGRGSDGEIAIAWCSPEVNTKATDGAVACQ